VAEYNEAHARNIMIDDGIFAVHSKGGTVLGVDVKEHNGDFNAI
jgi:hypothetical protein